MDKLDYQPLKLSTPKKWVPRPLVRVCGVCGSPATDVQHYGATSCYSCRWGKGSLHYLTAFMSRAFFRRTIGSGKDYRYCSRKTDACEVDAVTRTNCKKCRFQKCLQVGMKPEKVDRVRGKIKIKTEIKEERTEDINRESQSSFDSEEFVSFRDNQRSASESSQDSRNSVDITALAEECIIEEVKFKEEILYLPMKLLLSNQESNIQKDDKFTDNSEFIESYIPSLLNRSNPTLHITFEEEFRIHELLVRKDKLVDGIFQTFMELPAFQKCFEQRLKLINSGENLVFNGLCNQLVVLIRNYVVPNFMSGGVIRQSLEMFDGYQYVDESVKAETFLFSMPVLHLYIRAILNVNKNKENFVDQHRASGTFTHSLHKACSSLFPDSMDEIGSFDPLNISLFASPWAARFEDEEFFIRTIDHVGSIILDDVRLGSLYCTLILATPGINLSDAAHNDLSLQKVQREMTILIFRYLSHKFGDTVYADRATSALIKLLADLHICRDIHLFGRLAGPLGETCEDIDI